MKRTPFNSSEYTPDKKVITRDGRAVKVLAIENDVPLGVVCRVDNSNHINLHTHEGYFWENKTEVYLDLFFEEDQDKPKTTSFPESWEALGKITGSYIGSDSIISTVHTTVMTRIEHRNVIPSDLAEAFLAMMQLAQLRDRYREIEGFEGEGRFGILCTAVGVILNDFMTNSRSFFTFKTEAARDHFFKHHKALLETASPLRF